MRSIKGKCSECVLEGDDTEKDIFSKSNPLCPRHYKKQQALTKPYKRRSFSSGLQVSPGGRKSLRITPKSSQIDFSREDYSSMRLSTLVKFADYYFRRYLLGKTPRNAEGKIYCPLTEKWWKESEVHVCHLSPRQYYSTRWSEDNCILCAESSNVWEDKILTGGGDTLHIQKLREVLSKDKNNEKETTTSNTSSLTPPEKSDIINLIKKFRYGNL